MVAAARDGRRCRTGWRGRHAARHRGDGRRWSDDSVPEKLAGATVSMSVSFVAAARATDLTARARVVRRGRSLCFCEVTVSDAAGAVVAHGSMVHRYG